MTLQDQIQRVVEALGIDGKYKPIVLDDEISITYRLNDQRYLLSICPFNYPEPKE